MKKMFKDLKEALNEREIMLGLYILVYLSSIIYITGLYVANI